MLQNTFDVKQLIHYPTRVTPHTSTLIDHIYASNSLKSVCSGTIDKSLSGHYLVYSIFDIKKCKVVPLDVRCRNFNKFNHDQFLCELVKSETLKSIYSATDVNTAWHIFKTEYLKICQIFAPIRKILVKDRYSPWFYNEILLANIVYTCITEINCIGKQN